MAGPHRSDGRQPEKPPEYVDPDVRAAKYNHKSFVPGVNGDDADALERVVNSDCLVRVPCLPALYERELSGWAEPVKRRLALCIMHAGMRTMESNIKHFLKLFLEKFASGRGKDQQNIKQYLNDALKANLRGWSHTLVSVNQQGELNKITLNGDEVHILFDDLAEDNSKFLAAVKKTAGKLGVALKSMHFDAWTDVLKHWALMMKAGYVYEATDADRAAFARHARFYVLRKVCICEDALVWYDWQLHAVFPHLFQAFGSLRLICQEGVEAQQRLNNDLARRGNNGANVGRIPNNVIVRGVQAIAAYLRERKAAMASIAQTLWEKQLLSFCAEGQAAYEEYERLEAAGHAIDWETGFEPAWQSFIHVTHSWVRWAAMARFKLAQRKGSPHYDLMRSEYFLYYAPVPCESEEGFDALPEAVRRARVRTQRRARWAERARAAKEAGEEILMYTDVLS